jgi:hypothetical protein
MIRWAEIEIKANTKAAMEAVRLSRRLEKAETALTVAGIAFDHYSDEPDIVRSKDAVEDFVHSLKAAEALRRSVRAEERGDIERALSYAYDAEELTARMRGDGVESSLPRIRDDIERLKRLLTEPDSSANRS